MRRLWCGTGEAKAGADVGTQPQQGSPVDRPHRSAEQGWRMAKRVCEVCGAVLPVQTGRGRPRRKCVQCSPRKKVSQKVAPQPVPPAHAPESLTAAVEAEIAAAGQAGSATALLALEYARRIEDGGDAAAGIASLGKQLQALLVSMRQAATAASPTVSKLDEIRARRDARLRA